MIKEAVENCPIEATDLEIMLQVASVLKECEENRFRNGY